MVNVSNGIAMLLVVAISGKDTYDCNSWKKTFTEEETANIKCGKYGEPGRLVPIS